MSSDLLRRIYGTKHSQEFNWNALVAPPLLTFLSIQDIEYFRYLATSPKYSSKIEWKHNEIKRVMKSRGFMKLHAGTNRIVFYHPDRPNYVIKIATNSISTTDNPNEYRNQVYLAPFVTKCFEVSPCGTVGLFERVQAIGSRQEFLSIYDSIFDLLSKKVLGEYILEDIGTKYFLNFGIRENLIEGHYYRNIVMNLFELLGSYNA